MPGIRMGPLSMESKKVCGRKENGLCARGVWMRWLLDFVGQRVWTGLGEVMLSTVENAIRRDTLVVR